MNRSRSMLWMSVALLLFGSSLLVPDLIFEPGAARGDYPSRVAPPASSSSASLIDPGPVDFVESNAAADEAPQRLDVRGNEIARPVARYRVDARGSLYEVHSPHTEVPRLKPPVM